MNNAKVDVIKYYEKRKAVSNFKKDDVLNKDRRKTFSRLLGPRVHLSKMSSKSNVKCRQHLYGERKRESSANKGIIKCGVIEEG